MQRSHIVLSPHGRTAGQRRKPVARRQGPRYDVEMQLLCISLQGPPTLLQKLTEAERDGWRHSLKLCNLESQVCDICRLFTSSTRLRLSTVKPFLPPLRCIRPFIPPFIHPSSHPSRPPFLLRLSFLSPASLPPFSSPCLHQPSTMAIMTHLPVKLLPVETARPWHRTQCLSASLLRSPKSQVDIILTATGITPPYNASIFSRSLELKAPKQWAPIGRMRHKVNLRGSLGVRLRNKYGPAAHLFLDLLKCSERWLSILWDEKTAAFQSDLFLRYSGRPSPRNPLDKHINLHIMVMELCEECSYLTSDFSRGDLKEPPNYSFTCQSRKKITLLLWIFNVRSDCFGCWIKGINGKINKQKLA